ncbi:MAG: response regulator [Gammaproteobacteria bacterium]|nr:response regulator [Gammaproteobacteria bacterium]
MVHKSISEKQLLDKIRDKQILVIDDAGSSRDLIRSVLSELELMNVSVTHNGLDALDLFKEQKFDLVITDWDMPVMSGIEFVIKIRSQFDKQALPIIMLTANIQADMVKMAIAEGVNDFLAKPFQPANLQLKVIKLLGSRA